MLTVSQLTGLFGWASVLNMAFLMFAGIGVIAMRGFAVRVHGHMFGLDERDLTREYFRYLANYKILIFVFNLAPYFALKLVE